ncbi:MAG: hypothetical protein Q7K43_03915 [Candidatus Woesearchaeota archaeon]|nr:hypothetical protein [Candidatus Woesearchaeota archaeon]
MELITTAIVWGVIGGLVRALVGLRKANDAKRKIVWSRFVITLVEAGLIGAIIGGFLKEYGAFFNFIAGIAGTDLLDSAAKMLKLTPVKIPVK